jgi:hypothetical protein
MEKARGVHSLHNTMRREFEETQAKEDTCSCISISIRIRIRIICAISNA